MAPGKTQHYIIRGPGSALETWPAESHAQRNIANSNEPTPTAALFPMSLPSSYHEERNLHRALQIIAPELDVERIEKLPTARIQALYNISLTDGRSLVLTGPPETGSKHALRSEDKALIVEAAAVAWLAYLPLHGAQPFERGNHVDYGGCEPGRDVINYDGDSVNVNYVASFIPMLYKFVPKKDEPQVRAVAIWEPTRGTTISQLGRQLTELERESVDLQTGQLFRRLACHISPTGNFGPIGHILKSRSNLPFLHALGIFLPSPGEESPSDIGRSSWSASFKGYIEEVASDLEDFYVQMRFDVLRKHYHRFKHLLDKVKVPRLVAIQGADDANVMVSIKGETDTPAKGGWAVKGPQSPVSSRSADAKVEEPRTGAVRVTGLRDWSFFCFGDPLMAYVFQNGPSHEFRRGTETSFSRTDPLRLETLIEDEEHAPVRLLLYKAWHAACGVARQYHRVRDRGTDWEVVWRHQFVDALEALDTFNDNGKRILEDDDQEALPRGPGLEVTCKGK